MDSRIEDFIKKADRCLNQGKECFSNLEYDMSISRSYECIEFALKAVLIMVNGSYPQEHDVGIGLRDIYSKVPEYFKNKIPRFVVISKISRNLHTFAKYGYESLGASPKTLFEKHNAEAAIKDADEVLLHCRNLFDDINSKI